MAVVYHRENAVVSRFFCFSMTNFQSACERITIW